MCSCVEVYTLSLQDIRENMIPYRKGDRRTPPFFLPQECSSSCDPLLVRPSQNRTAHPAPRRLRTTQAMHISVTTLKRLCRRHGVKRWPHRQICGINRSLNDLEAQHDTAKGEEMDSVADQLRQLHRRREVIIEVCTTAVVEGTFDSNSQGAL